MIYPEPRFWWRYCPSGLCGSAYPLCHCCPGFPSPPFRYETPSIRHDGPAATLTHYISGNDGRKPMLLMIPCSRLRSGILRA